jgi:hypothetical protein
MARKTNTPDRFEKIGKNADSILGFWVWWSAWPACGFEQTHSHIAFVE